MQTYFIDENGLLRSRLISSKLLTPEDLPKLNTALIEETFRVITEKAKNNQQIHPNTFWDQSTWCEETQCGTAMCFCGWGLFLTDNLEFAPGYGMQPKKVLQTHQGEIRSIPGLGYQPAGAFVFGFTADEALQIFRGENSIEMIRICLQQAYQRRGMQFPL